MVGEPMNSFIEAYKPYHKPRLLDLMIRSAMFVIERKISVYNFYRFLEPYY